MPRSDKMQRKTPSTTTAGRRDQTFLQCEFGLSRVQSELQLAKIKIPRAIVSGGNWPTKHLLWV